MNHQLPIEASDTHPVKTAAFYGMYTTMLARRSSLADQLRICQKHAESSGFVILPEHSYTDLHGQGKSKVGRPGFEALQRVAGQSPKPFDYVLIDDMHRCSRDHSDLVKFTKLLHVHGIGVRFITQQLDSKDQNFNMILAIQNLMDEELVSRFRAKCKKAAQQ